MGFRLKTSKDTMDNFEYLESRMKLQPFALSKIAIMLSLKEKENILEIEDEDQKGLELNRQTIMGDYDEIFKCAIESDLKRSLTDDEYFPKYAKKHLDRGAKLLRKKYDYNGNYEKLFKSLLEGNIGIWYI